LAEGFLSLLALMAAKTLASVPAQKATPPARSDGIGRRFKVVLLPCLLFLCVTVPHLEQGDFRRDTGRYAAVGLYLWESGEFLAPRFGPETPYFNKPPLALLVHGAFLKVFGRNLVAARLPSILAALGVVTLSVLTARKIGSNSEAIISGMVLASTIEFFRRTREISLDFWQLFFVMLAVYLFVSGLKEGKQLKMVLSGIGIGLALLCKPFVALGLLPVFIFWAVMTRRAGLIPAILCALIVAVAVAAPWHYYMWSRFGTAFTRQYFLNEVVGRAQGARGREPFFYYAGLLLTSYWPWLIGLCYALYYRLFRSVKGANNSAEPAHSCLHPSNRLGFRNRARDLVLLGGVWVLWVLLLISIFPDKTPNYALPLYPMLSWIVATGLCRLPWKKLRAWYHSGFKGFAPATVALMVVLSLAPIRFQEGPNKDWQRLLGWMKVQSTPAEQMAAAGLKPNDLCYFYVKTGVWLPNLDAGSALSSRQWVLTIRTETNAIESIEPVFASGHIQVMAATNWNQKASGR
jgi:4-amino-4-deoxy-L-arabinose transferase-like glycosyltransferase